MSPPRKYCATSARRINRKIRVDRKNKPNRGRKESRKRDVSPEREFVSIRTRNSRQTPPQKLVEFVRKNTNWIENNPDYLKKRDSIISLEGVNCYERVVTDIKYMSRLGGHIFVFTSKDLTSFDTEFWNRYSGPPSFDEIMDIEFYVTDRLKEDGFIIVRGCDNFEVRW